MTYSTSNRYIALYGFALILIANLFAFIANFTAFFVKDDLILLATAHLNLDAWKHSWPLGFYRPAAEWLYALQFRLFGTAPLPYHLVSFAAHMAAAFFVYLTVRRLCQDRALALGTSLIFSLHPLNTEVVSWISGQMSLFAGLCSFGALAYFPTDDRGLQLRAWAATLLFCILGLAFYESFAIVPVFLAVFGMLILRRTIAASIFGILGCLYFYWRFAAMGLRGGYYEPTLSLEAFSTNIVYYLYLLQGGSAIGGRLIHYQPDRILANFFDVFPPLFIVNTMIIILALLLIRSESKARDTMPRSILAAGMWVIIALLPALFLPERPRRLAYMATPGYAALLYYCLLYIKQKTRLSPNWAVTGCVAYVAILAISLAARNGDWKAAGQLERETYTLSAEAVKKSNCTQLVFDVPNLLGDALYLNKSALAHWLRNSTGRNDLLVKGRDDFPASASPGPGICWFVYRSQRIQRVQTEIPPPHFYTRDNSWVAPD